MMKVYFHCKKYESPEQACYQHTSIGLAQGLKELGHNIYSNVDYWQERKDSDNYLFKNDSSIEPRDCEIEIFTSVYFEYNNNAKKIFSGGTSSYKVFIDQSDGPGLILGDNWIPKFDLILRTHMSDGFNYPSNVEPWAFGLTNRLLNYTSDFNKYKRNREIIVNFRVDHYLRKAGVSALEKCTNNLFSLNHEVDAIDHVPQSEYDEHLWKQTGRRHYPSYFNRLKKSRAIAAFGGYFLAPSIMKNISSLNYIFNTTLSFIPNRLLDHVNISKNVFQWDSYRLWEAWVSGCVPIHIDFEKYGVKMPEIPDNNVHYLGLDLTSPSSETMEIFRNERMIESISNAGREWCIRNYSPIAQAERFLDHFKRA